MNDRPRVLLAVTPLVERVVEAELFGTAPTVEVVAGAAEADELEELVAAHSADAVLLSPDLSGLTGAHCARASAAGLRVVGLALDEVGRERLAELGVDEILVVPLEEGALAAAASGPKIPVPKVAPHRPLASHRPDGNVLAVIGSHGSPGASECAASLAALAASRWQTVLVEVDALGSSLDVRLGADALQGSLTGLARAVAEQQTGIDALIERWLLVRAGWSRVLLGAPDPSRDLTQPGSASKAIRVLAATGALVVCDVGFLIAVDEPAGVSVIARVHRETIATADAVVLVVGACDAQLRHGLSQLDTLADDLDVAPERLRLIVNGVGAPGAASRVEIEAALLARLAERGLAVDAWIPWDRRALVLARRRGLPLATARPRGPYHRALARLLDELLLPTAPIARGRKHRLSLTAPASIAAGDEEEEVVLPWR